MAGVPSIHVLAPFLLVSSHLVGVTGPVKHGFLVFTQVKTSLSRMTRERETLSAQLTQADQVKLIAEGELAEVCTIVML